MSSFLAQIPLGTFNGIGPLGSLKGSPSEVFGQLDAVISITIGVLTISGGLWFIFQFFAGAVQWLGSGGEKQALQNAQKRISNAIIGLLVVVLSYTLIAIIGSIVGLHILAPFDALSGASPPGGGPGPGGGSPVPTPDCSSGIC